MGSAEARAVLIRLHARLGFVDAEGRPLALHAACARAPGCWAEVPPEHRPGAGEARAQAYLPWVGEHYPESRLLVVGLNMNESGGPDVYRSQVPAAQEELLARSRLRFGNDPRAYRGTMYDVRLLLCAWAALRALGVGPLRDAADEDLLAARTQPHHPRRRDFAAGYDFLAMTNAVKCGPLARPGGGQEGPVRYRNGAPTGAMVRECPAHVLRPEIDALRPQMVLALGQAAEAAVRALAPEGARVVGAPHGAWPGFRDRDVLRNLVARLSGDP